MQIHALDLDEFYEDDFSLIGIHTTLEDYKLAYLLNKSLQTRFVKSKENLVFKHKNKASFSLFTYENNKYEDEWCLIANSSKNKNKTASNELLLTSETKTYLIPERKKIDYFIKISGDVTTSYVNKTVKKIQKIDQIITSYFIDKNTLKSKDFLIF